MIKLQGKRNSAIIFADKIDKQTKTQISELLREEAYADSKIRIMPDTHSGKNVAVGTTMTVKNRIAASLVGVDIGCGMEVVFLKQQEIDPEKLDRVIHSLVPAGTKIHGAPITSFDFDALHCKDLRGIGAKACPFARSATSLGVSPHHCEAHHLHGVQHRSFVPRGRQ